MAEVWIVRWGRVELDCLTVCASEDIANRAANDYAELGCRYEVESVEVVSEWS